MQCKTCGKELITIYKGIWEGDRTRIEPEFVCPNHCVQEAIIKHTSLENESKKDR